MHFDLAFLIMNRKYSLGVFFGGGGGAVFFKGVNQCHYLSCSFRRYYFSTFQRKTLSSIFDLTRDPAPEKKVLNV